MQTRSTGGDYQHVVRRGERGPSGTGLSPLDDVIVGYRTNNIETEITANAIPHPTDPVSTFTFDSDGVARYDLFIRENNTQNRSRLNAVRLTLIPEPGSTMLALGGIGVLLFRRRRRP